MPENKAELSAFELERKRPIGGRRESCTSGRGHLPMVQTFQYSHSSPVRRHLTLPHDVTGSLTHPKTSRD